jgi:hypothetical protein
VHGPRDPLKALLSKKSLIHQLVNIQHAASPTSSANISLSQASRFLHSSEFSLAELPTFPFKLFLFSL